MDEAAVKNVLVLVVDALRYDRVETTSETELTPRLASLAEDGTEFEQAYACINTTDPSVTTILTGQYPTRHGLLNHGPQITEKDRERVSGTVPLSVYLQETHRTIACDLLGRWHERGFDEYLSAKKQSRNGVLSTLERVIIGLPDALETPIRTSYRKLRGIASDSDTPDRYVDADTVTETMVDAIQRADGPWFVFGHYWDTHLPYVPPEAHVEAVTDRTYEDGDRPLETLVEDIVDGYWGDRLVTELTPECETVGDVKRQYDAAVRFVDEQIGRLIDELKENGVYDETAVVVTADHGESLTEHGIYFEHHGLYDQSIHVPLLIDAPGFSGRETQFVQHFDLVPTILDLCGRDVPTKTFDGVSLATEGPRSLNRDAVYAEEAHTVRRRAIRTESRKYIELVSGDTTCRYCEVPHADETELYDLTTDPGETENRSPERPEERERFGERLSEWTSSLPEPETAETDFSEDEEVIEHLESMGYL